MSMSLSYFLNLEVDQYATNNIQFLWLEDSTNLPVDLTGYTANMMVVRNPGEVGSLLTLSTANGKIVLGGVLGTINITIQPSDLDFSLPGAVEWYTGHYDLYLTNTNDNSVTRLHRGLITVLRGFTH